MPILMSRGSKPITPSDQDDSIATSTTILGEHRLSLLMQDGVALSLGIFPAHPGTEKEDVSMPSKTDSTETISPSPSTPKKNTSKTRRLSLYHLVGKRRVDLAYAIGDNAQIDEGDITGMVVAISITSGGIKYQVEWMHQGSNQSSWFDALRLNEP